MKKSTRDMEPEINYSDLILNSQTNHLKISVRILILSEHYSV